MNWANKVYISCTVQLISNDGGNITMERIQCKESTYIKTILDNDPFVENIHLPIPGVYLRIICECLRMYNINMYDLTKFNWCELRDMLAISDYLGFDVLMYKICKHMIYLLKNDSRHGWDGFSIEMINYLCKSKKYASIITP
jgi:hypothetical protein